MSDKHPLRTFILGTALGGLLLGLIQWFTGFISIVWNACKSALFWLFSFFISSISVPIWLIVAMSLFIFPTLIRIFAYFKRKDMNHTGWRDYTQDDILEMRWRWHYSPYGGGIANISYFCPSDDTELIYEDWGSQVLFRCETCKGKFGPYDGSPSYIIERVKRQIRRKIRTDGWKSVAERLG